MVNEERDPRSEPVAPTPGEPVAPGAPGAPGGPAEGHPAPTAPDEIEALEEFETVPQTAAGEADWPSEPGLQRERAAAPPSAVESFDRPAAAAPAAPAAIVAESTRCPRCGTENQPGIAFCRQCGQRLVAPGAATVERPGAPAGMQTCARCGTVNRAGTPFCQNCGANLRTTAPVTDESVEPPAPYIPPPVAVASARPAAAAPRERAVLGPIVLLIGTIGLSVGWLLPFAYGRNSLFQRGFGRDGYGYAFWNASADVGDAQLDQAYFGFAAAVPILAALLLILAVVGFARARPRIVQVLGLLLALVWVLGLGGLFVTIEVMGADTTELTQLLRSLSAGGIIFFLSSIVIVIGVLTRFARS